VTEITDTGPEGDLIRHLQRYPADILDIRRLQRSYEVSFEVIALILDRMDPGH